ncbi:response regulator transcription factor [Kitasatospora sp. NPDC088346]|uniref:helix-turn-helix transcriptional regulator n=1 Tax=Kitasatospora sp. NPDC088346 TaxID=3364073 RepID=UPI00381DBCCD
MNPVSVAVLSGDPLSSAGVAAMLRPSPAVNLLPASRRAEADVLLLLTGEVTEETLGCLEKTARESENPAMRMVIVGDVAREQHLMRAVSSGVTSVIHRREATPERLLRAVIGARDGHAEMPGHAVAWLVEWVRAIQHDVLAPNGLTTSPLESREVEVIRLIAEGLETATIAERLNYSERTIKNIIHGAMSRLNLHNRAHTVAYALRAGVI